MWGYHGGVNVYRGVLCYDTVVLQDVTDVSEKHVTIFYQEDAADKEKNNRM
jgi:hypothetical protein